MADTDDTEHRCGTCNRKGDYLCCGCFLYVCTAKRCKAKHEACATSDELADLEAAIHG